MSSLEKDSDAKSSEVERLQRELNERKRELAGRSDASEELARLQEEHANCALALVDADTNRKILMLRISECEHLTQTKLELEQQLRTLTEKYDKLKRSVSDLKSANAGLGFLSLSLSISLFSHTLPLVYVSE